MDILLLIFLLTQAPFAPSEQTQSERKPSISLYARTGIPIWDLIWEKRTLMISSLDRRKVLMAKAEERGLRLYVIADGRQFQVAFPAEAPECVGAEAGWSPDSKAFFLTCSAGGRVGQYHTLIYRLTEDGLRRFDLTPVIEQVFGNPVKCAWPESPNVAAIAWLKDSSRLLVAAQILPHSVCDNMGTFKVYQVSLPEGKIVHEYGQIEAKQLFWQYLGDELRNADDECIRNPKVCEIPYNHPERQP